MIILERSYGPTFDFTMANSFKSLIAVNLKFVIFKLGILFAFPVDSELINEIMKSIKHPSSFIVINDNGKIIFMMIKTILFFNSPLFWASLYSFLKGKVGTIIKISISMHRKFCGKHRKRLQRISPCCL